MKNKNTHYITINRIILLILILFYFVSCKKETYDFNKIGSINYQPEVALPLIKSDLTLADLLKGNSNQLFTTDSSGYMKVTYSGNLFSFKGGDLIKLTDQAIVIPKIGIGNNVTFLPGFDTITVPKLLLDKLQIDSAYSFDMSLPKDANGNPIQVDSIKLSKGSLNIQIQTTFKNPTAITLTIKSIKDAQGNIFKKVINFDWKNEVIKLIDGGGVQYILNSTNIDLTGYTLDLTNGDKTGNTFNKINANFDITLTNDQLPINKFDYINGNISINGLDFNLVSGYFGNQSFNLPLDTLSLGIFSKSGLQGSFRLADPRITLNMVNYYGMPIEAKFSTFKGIAASGASLNFNQNGSSPIISLKTPSKPGDSATTPITFNKTNTNIVDLISLMPNTLLFGVSATSNPLGKAGGKNFITKDAKFNVGLNVELPLYGAASNFVIKDTVPMTPPDLTMVESGTLRLNINNGFPFDIGIQIYLTDSKYKIIDSIFKSPESNGFYTLIASAAVGLDGKVTTQTPKLTDIPANALMFTHLSQTKYMIVKALLNTANQGKKDVKVYTTYKIGIQLGVKAKINYKVKPSGN